MVDLAGLDPIGRLGADYCRVTDVFEAKAQVANQQFPALVERSSNIRLPRPLGTVIPVDCGEPDSGVTVSVMGPGLTDQVCTPSRASRGAVPSTMATSAPSGARTTSCRGRTLSGQFSARNEARPSPPTRVMPSSRPGPPRAGFSATQEAGVFDVLGERSQVGTEGTIHDAVVAGERHAHSPADGQTAVDDDGYRAIPPTAKMQASGGFRMAVNCSTPFIPRLEMVKVELVYSSGASLPSLPL